MRTDFPVKTFADELAQAARTREPIEPLRKRVPQMTVDDAYKVQLHQLNAHLATGRRLVGRKIGLTSVAMQKQLGIDSPDFGFLLDDMIYSDGDVIRLDGFIAPRIEPELAFVLGSTLTGPGVTLEEAAGAVEFVFAAMEIIDSRVRDWDIGLVDTIADNASSGALVLGREPLDVAPWSTSEVAVRLSRNGIVEKTGTGDGVLGDPVAPLAWLANLLGDRGFSIEAGSVIITGSFTQAILLNPGDRISTTYDGLGDVSVTFI